MSFEERFIFDGCDNGDVIANEHLVRYQFVSKFVRNKRVLDIACGSGYGSRILAESGASSVLGMDKDVDAVKKANAVLAGQKEKGNDTSLPLYKGELEGVSNLIYKEGDVLSIKAQEGEYDVVVSFETIEHLADHESYTKELFRVVSDEGLVFISTPNKEVFGNRNPFHVKELTKKEFTDLLQKHFPFVVCFEQENAVCSLLKLAGENRLKEVGTTSSSEKPLYFLAICSKKEISEKDFWGQGMASASSKAYERAKNNPVLKIADKIYPLYAKIFKKRK